MSSTTRLTSGTSLVIRVEIRASTVVGQPGPVGRHGILAGDRPQHDRMAVGCDRRLARPPIARRPAARPGTARSAGPGRLRSARLAAIASAARTMRSRSAVTSPTIRIAEARAGERLPPDDLRRAGQARRRPARTSSLNSVRSGSTSSNFRSSGSPPTLWWDLMLAVPVPPPDSTTSGYRVPWTRNVRRLDPRRRYLARGLLERPDELPPDDLALLLRVGDAGQRAEEAVGGVDDLERHAGGRDEVLLHLLSLARAQ